MPAPYRYIVGRPGDPNDEYDEACPVSDWLQPDDQTADMVIPNTSTFEPEPGGISIGSTQYKNDPPLPPCLPLEETSAMARSVSDSGDAGAGIGGGRLTVQHTTWTMYGGGGEGGDDDPVQYFHNLYGSRSASGTTVMCSPQDIVWRDDWRPSWPADAIGYEVEQAELNPDFWVPAAAPQSLALDVTFAPTVTGGTFQGAAHCRINHQWGNTPVTFMYSGSLLDATLLKRAADSLNAADDGSAGILEHGMAPAGATAPMTYNVNITDLTVSPPFTGLLGVYSTVKCAEDGGETSVIDGDEMVASSNVSVAGVYTIRPPRIRWVYAAPVAVPVIEGEALSSRRRFT